MLTLPLTLVLALWLQTGQPPQTTQPPPARPAAPRATTLDVRVTDRTGATIEGAHVRAEGPLSRSGETDRNGSVTFKSLTAGTYRLRVERDGFITLEKEVTVRAGTTNSAEAAITTAPKAPPAPPPPAPMPAAPAPAPLPAPGEPRIISIPNLVEKEFIGPKEPIKENPIGCSGATLSKVIQVREPLAAHTHADADEVLYVVAGDATLRLGEKEQQLTGGWFVIVPRGMSHSVTRRGRNPVILLSVLGGQPCSGR